MLCCPADTRIFLRDKIKKETIREARRRIRRSKKAIAGQYPRNSKVAVDPTNSQKRQLYKIRGGRRRKRRGRRERCVYKLFKKNSSTHKICCLSTQLNNKPTSQNLLLKEICIFFQIQIYWLSTINILLKIYTIFKFNNTSGN